MKRILLVTSLVVPGFLFAVERNVIYLAFVAATVVLWVLFAVAHRKPVPETSARRMTMTEESNTGTKERKNLVHQPSMHL
jgi:cytoskeletal protein RodZ